MSSKIGPQSEHCAPGAVQGCGNPSCEICLPRDGRAAGGALGGGGGGTTRDRARGLDFATFTISNLEAIAMAYGLNERVLGKKPPYPGANSASVRAEEAAREPIKKYLLSAEHGVQWSDIAGNEEAHRAMIEAIEFPVKHRELYQFYQKKTTKGILLCGPPGCGKTMFGKAAAGVVAQLHGKETSSFLSIKASELQQPFVGQTEQIIRNIFAYARAYKARYDHQLVVFIDEADAILPSREGITSRRALPWEESNVSTFLTEMDGLEESGALVILATNRPHAIDSALLRDGRCDRKITVRRPTEAAARTIFTKAIADAPTTNDRELLVDFAMREFFSPLRHLLKIKTNRGVDYMTLGHIVSGAMVGLVERAKANAFHRDIAAGSRSGISDSDILAAIEAVMAENLGKPDVYALQEYAERVGPEFLEVEPIRAKIKYAGSETLQ